MPVKYTIEEVRNIFIDHNLNPLFTTYKNCKEKLLCTTNDIYQYKILLNLDFLINNGFKINNSALFSHTNLYYIENFQKWLDSNDRNIEIIGSEKRENYYVYKFKCKIDGNEWEASINSIMHGKGCKECNLKKIQNNGAHKLNIESVKKEVMNCGYIPLFDSYISTTTPLLLSVPEGYLIELSLSNVLKNKDKSNYIFNVYNKYFIYNINLWLSNNDKKFTLKSKRINSLYDDVIWEYSNAGKTNAWKQSVISILLFGKTLKYIPKSKSDFLYHIKKIKHLNYIPLFNEYTFKLNKKMLFFTPEGYIVSSNINNVSKVNNAVIFGKANSKWTIFNIKKWLMLNNIQLELLSNVFISSNKKLIFKCKKDNAIFKMSWNAMQCGNRCPKCSKSKGESKIEKWLIENIDYIPQKTFEGLIGLGNGKLSYDFYLPKHDLFIEYQGEQHDRPVDFSGRGEKYAKEQFKIQQEHDKRKREYAKQNNIELLEIWYWDYDNIEEILRNKLKQEKEVL